MKTEEGVTHALYGMSISLTTETCKSKLLFFFADISHPYPETTNKKRYWNQQAFIGSKYLSGNNLLRINLIRGKLFPDRYLHPILACCAFVVVICDGWARVTGVYMCKFIFLYFCALCLCGLFFVPEALFLHTVFSKGAWLQLHFCHFYKG